MVPMHLFTRDFLHKWTISAGSANSFVVFGSGSRFSHHLLSWEPGTSKLPKVLRPISPSSLLAFTLLRSLLV